MNAFWAATFPGPAFALFSPLHLAAIGTLITFYVASLLWLRRHPDARPTFRYVMAAVLVVDELVLHAWWISSGHWSIQTMLPFHLCAVLVWTSAVLNITGNRIIYEFIYFLGIAGATQAILTPDLGPYNFPHVRYFSVFISHGSIVWTGLYWTLIEGYRPTWKSVPRVLGGLGAYAAIVAVINTLIGSNYLFIAHKPLTPSLIDVLPAWPWYIPVLGLMAVVLVLLLYAPFAIGDARRRRAAAQG